MNQATRTKIERFTRAKLTEIFGSPDPEGIFTGPYGTGHITIRPIFDDTPWLACRLRNPSFTGTDGYRLPKSQLDWPHQFTYPSGKHNLHSFKNTTFEEWELDFVQHLLTLTERGSPQRAVVELIPFNTYSAKG